MVGGIKMDFEEKMIMELQKTVDEIRWMKENGYDYSSVFKTWQIQSMMAESILGKSVTFKSWEVVVK